MFVRFNGRKKTGAVSVTFVRILLRSALTRPNNVNSNHYKYFIIIRSINEYVHEILKPHFLMYMSTAARGYLLYRRHINVRVRYLNDIMH